MNRSEIMAAVKSKDTHPEKVVRRMLFALGYRYRLHAKNLPGCPDIVFPSRRKAIFVHGCFWHGHRCRAGRNRPASNTEYWNRKLTGNVNRDRHNIKILKKAGWSIHVIWECETRDSARMSSQLAAFLRKSAATR